MYFDRILSPYPLLPPPQNSPFFSINLLTTPTFMSFSCVCPTPFSWDCLNEHGWGHLLKQGRLTNDYTTGEYDCPLKPVTVYNSSGSGEASGASLYPCWKPDRLSLVQINTAAVNSQMQGYCHVQKRVFYSLLPIFSILSSHNVP